jgi:predicted phage terminase large subunit-like protein
LSSIDLDINFLPWQSEVFDDPTRFKVVAAGRRCGKSRLAAYMLILSALSEKAGQVFYVAPTQGQARDIMWQTLLDIGHDVIVGAHVNNLQIKLFNGGIISLKGSDRPETMRGVSLKFLVLDEYADMKPEVWSTILRPALTDQMGSALFIGTPMGRNHFYDLYTETSLGAKENHKAWHFTSYDNPLLARTEIEEAKRTLPSWAFRQEYEASFEARGSEMFKEEWVKYSEDPPSTGEYFVACDLAGFAEAGKKDSKRLDNTAIAIVKVNQEGWFVEKMIAGRWDVNETAVKIFEAVRKYQPTRMGIEKGLAKQAVMGPLNDLMKRTGRFFRVEELTHGNQKKNDRIMWALQGRFENGWITLNKGEWNSQFLDELFQFPDPMTHDDTVDALAYIDQLAKDISYNLEDLDIEEWEPEDPTAGY